MGSVTNLRIVFYKIFNAAQLSSGSHQKSAMKLTNLYNLVNGDEFFNQFKRFMVFIFFMDAKLKCPYTERITEFIALCCYTMKKAYDETIQDDFNEEAFEHPFIEKLMLYLLELQEKENFNIRYRSCHLVTKILDRLTETELSIKFCDNIERTMLDRLNDPKLEVRLEAILALHRFQDKRNPSDQIISILNSLMESDRFAKVRRVCVEKISLREDVIPVMLLKIRDVDIGVRLAAYVRLTKIAVGLKIHQRRVVLKCARLDTSPKIKSYIELTLLPQWLICFYNSIHNFMKAIRLDAQESDIEETNELCEFILGTLFKSKPLDDLIRDVNVDGLDKIIAYENLNWETSNYWRILVQFIRRDNYLEDQIQEILPELVHFCRYVKGYCNNPPHIESTTDFLETQFIIKQLFTITKGYDVSDPVGRSALHNLIGTVLANVVLTLDTVKVIVSNLENIIPQVEHRVRYINQLISEIQSPENFDDLVSTEIDHEFKMKALKASITEASHLQEKAIAEKNYELAGSLEEKLKHYSVLINELTEEKSSRLVENIPKKKDVATLVKCLDIALGLLMSPQITKMTSSLETLKNEHIYELMIHENEAVQSKALHCYALFCIRDKKTATNGIHLFSAPISGYQSGQECDIQILLTCIKSIVDLLRIYGTQLIAAPEDAVDLSESRMEDHKRHFFGGTSLTNIVQGLVDLMDDEQIEVLETAGRGLCSLVFHNIIQSSSLLSRLVLKWCNPFGESEKLKQIIGVTLQHLPNTPDFHKQWENAILITLKTIIYAPADSSYGQLNVEDIAKFMFALYHINLEDNGILLNFAMKLCLEIRKKPKAKQVLMLTKALNMLSVTEDHPMIDDLLAVCDDLSDVIHNYQVTINLKKFITKLTLAKSNESFRTKRKETERNVSHEDGEGLDEEKCNQTSSSSEEEP